MKVRKVLKIQIVSSPSRSTDTYSFRIVEQSHRGSEFGDGVPYFSASNGIELTSSGHPEIGYQTLYVRGSSWNEDNKTVKADGALFRRIQAAIQEYNDYYAGKEKSIGQSDYLKRMGIAE